jgi:small subunit ribosomal protein S1
MAEWMHPIMPDEITPAIAAESASHTEMLPTELPPDATLESFADLLAEFESVQSRTDERGAKQIDAAVVSLDADSVYLDIGYKTEGILPRTAFDQNADALKSGDKFTVSVKGRNEEGYYELSRKKIVQPTDWSSLELAFEQKAAVIGTVTAVVKGGLTVDIGVRAFMPASRSGVRETAEMEKLVGQEITCRITKLDATEEDVVVDRRIVLEEQAHAVVQGRYAELKEGDIVDGQVRSFATYGAFIDLGGIDGLLHIGDIALSRINAPEDVLSVGQQLQLKVLKIDPENRRISLGLKQLQPEPWDTASERYSIGQRISGTVSRLTDFGAFVVLQPGIEGLIHISEMSWVKRIHKPSDILKVGDTVDAVILSISPGERRISLGLKQALGDPWTEVPHKFPVGSAIEGPVTRLMKFGAFVQLAEGVEGLVHVSEITAERHINHPQDVLRADQMVKALVLAIDAEKRQIKLSMKQLIPTGLDEYLEEHKQGDIVSGRVVDQSAEVATIELGEGIRATCRIAVAATDESSSGSSAGLDLSALTSMLNARWKNGGAPAKNEVKSLQTGQIRSFRIAAVDREARTIEVALA